MHNSKDNLLWGVQLALLAVLISALAILARFASNLPAGPAGATSRSAAAHPSSEVVASAQDQGGE